ncbi:hypothetical protein EIP86_004945 [Pleurotus ostreatoroseus]|nr:hypothetical protein EIP86_004945 [Pleurotus ostreatoroseus]
MEPSTSSARAFAEPLPRLWSPPARPTVNVNTAILAQTPALSTPVDRSPHPSAPNSTNSSPWLQQMVLAAGSSSQSMSFNVQHTSPTLPPMPRATDLPSQTSSRSSLANGDWGNVFSSPLDPSTFAALAASGVLPPPAASGLPSSLPATAMRPNDYARVSVAPRANQPWTPIHSPYSGTPPMSHRVSPSHIRTQSGNLSYSKRKSPGADSNRSTAPTSADSPKSNRKFSDLFADELFPTRKPSSRDGPPSSFASPIVSGSPDLKSSELLPEDVDPEELAKQDPLATQVWKMYAKTKATLPNGQRMENLTWRMMALALKKKKEDEDRKVGDKASPSTDRPAGAEGEAASERPPASGDKPASEERGRPKGKAKVRVVGFDGTNQDGTDDNAE